MGLFSIFKSGGKKSHQNLTKVDMHSHLIYDVDDGSKTIDESIELIKKLKALGYTDIYTTPHIMADFYKNSKDNLLPKRDEIINQIEKENLQMNFDVAAEYYLDDGFSEKLKDKDNLLIINNKYLLVETSYMNEPNNLNTLIFDILSSGITPILAHPERYIYMYDDFDRYEELFERGVLFQINLNSLSGYYSKPAKDIANKLIDKNMVHFSGTDCHGERHIEGLKKAFATDGFEKLQKLDLLNNSLAK